MSSLVLPLEISLNVTIVKNFMPVYTHGCLTGNHGMNKLIFNRDNLKIGKTLQ